jgi:hypothetical protein
MSVLEDLGAALDQSIIVGSVPRSGHTPEGGSVKISSNPHRDRTPLFCYKCLFGYFLRSAGPPKGAEDTALMVGPDA